MTMRALVSADRPVVRIWEACLAAAKDEGIAREDIEEETGDLVTYMGAVIANLVNHPERGAPSTDDTREEFIRTKAFYI